MPDVPSLDTRSLLTWKKRLVIIIIVIIEVGVTHFGSVWDDVWGGVHLFLFPGGGGRWRDVRALVRVRVLRLGYPLVGEPNRASRT